jgi:DNA polymerase III delta prime subunit
MTNREEFLWVEKYRPQTIQDCVLPERMKDYFTDMVKKGEIQNMLLVGGPGTGKTTVARALCNELGIDYLMVNASENGNIDLLRTTIRSFASTMSFTSKYKVVILDEADYLNANSTQPALRNFIEEFSKNCRFIMTANYANRIIDPLKSRCAVVDFQFSKEEKQQMVVSFDRRVKDILENEGVTYDKKVLAQVLVKYFPDFRKILNELQRHTSGGSLESAVLTSLSDDSIKKLFSYLRDTSKWPDMRKWVVDNLDNDFNLIARAIYERADEYVKPGSIPQLVMTIAQFDYKNSFVMDKEINLVAMLTEIMAQVEFK